MEACVTNPEQAIAGRFSGNSNPVKQKHPQPSLAIVHEFLLLRGLHQLAIFIILGVCLHDSGSVCCYGLLLLTTSLLEHH